MQTLIGIDPGVSGGIAWLKDGVLAVSKMPETESDVYALFKDIGPGLCLIERVYCQPVQGVKAAFGFGRNYGFLRACLIANGIPFDEVTPQKWQRFFCCLTKGDKNVSKGKAQQMFPQLKITHATADALLILEYLRRRELGSAHGESNRVPLLQ